MGIRSLPDSENRVDLVELVALEMQVIFHPRDVGIGEIGSIKLGDLMSDPYHKTPSKIKTHIVRPVHQTAEREDEEVELSQQLPLTGQRWRPAHIFNELGTHFLVSLVVSRPE
jgi:hypothetical protein